MAKLEDIANSLNVNLDTQTKATGRKRRAWLEEEDTTNQEENNPIPLSLKEKHTNLYKKTEDKINITEVHIDYETLAKSEQDINEVKMPYPEAEIDKLSYHNLSQSEAKLEPKLGRNLGQSEVKHKPNLSQNKKRLTGKKQKLEPKLGQNLGHNLSQSRAKLEPNTSFSGLVGLQRNIVLLVNEICRSTRDKQTEPLSIEFITTKLNSTKSAVRKAIQRLEQKNILIRSSFKNGRGGWTKYKLAEHIHYEMLRVENYQLEPNLSQSEAKLRTELRTELEPNLSSSSSSYKKETTTETGLSEEWNLDVYSYQSWGFSHSQLKQLASLAIISASDVEQSLIQFNFDIENNLLPNIKTTRINYLMGLLRKGVSYTSEAYLNDQEATIIEMARRASSKKENLLKAKFEAWATNLNDEEKKEIEKKLPTHLIALYRSYGILNHEVKDYLYQNYYLKLGLQ